MIVNILPGRCPGLQTFLPFQGDAIMIPEEPEKRRRTIGMKRDIQVQVMFFHVLRDLVGREKEKMQIESGTTVSDLLMDLYAEHPQLDELDQTVMLAVNQEYSKRSRVLEDGDEVALLPPVGGG